MTLAAALGLAQTWFPSLALRASWTLQPNLGLNLLLKPWCFPFSDRRSPQPCPNIACPLENLDHREIIWSSCQFALWSQQSFWGPVSFKIVFKLHLAWYYYCFCWIKISGTFYFGKFGSEGIPCGYCYLTHWKRFNYLCIFFMGEIILHIMNLIMSIISDSILRRMFY